MAKALSPVRVARVNRLSFQAAREDVELNFQLGLKQGVALLAAEFLIGGAVLVPSTTMISHTIHSSLHLETGSLEEDASNFTEDSQALNSETVADAILIVQGQDEAATRGGSAISMVWGSPKRWDFRSLFGEPLLIAQNITATHITSNALLTANRTVWKIFYQYVELTDAELAGQFILRR